MSSFCNNICQRYRALMPKNSGRYSLGQKRCNECAIFIFWDGLFCPCCNNRLRLAPRTSKYKERYLDVKLSEKELITHGT